MIWTILGISVAILAAYAVSVAELLVGNPIFEDHRLHVAGALTGMGVVAYFTGRWLGGRRAAAGDEGNDNLFLLSDLRYWGPMLLAFGIIALFIRPLHFTNTETVLAAAKPAPRQVVVVAESAPPPVAPAPKAPAVFPKLRMQGIIFRETRPFAIINGESYTVGDYMGNIQVLAIDRTSVMLGLEGETRTLTLN